MRLPRFGGWVVGIWLALQVSQAFSATLLFLADRETPLSQTWSRDFRPLLTTSFTLAPSVAGVALHGFLATERPGSPQPEYHEAGAPHSSTDLCRRKRVQVVVAAGPEAARAVVRECRLPTLMIGMSRAQVAPLLAEEGDTTVSAIYLEAEPSLNLRLVRALLPAARTVGVLVPTPAPGWLAPLRTEAHRLNFTLDEIPVTDDLGTVRALRPRLPGLDSVLLPPDATVINEWSLKPLLLMTIRQGIPTFGGLTARYVDAGVLAAVVADEERLPAQIETVVVELARSRAPAPAYPTAVRVVVNPTVAQTLGVAAEAVARARALFSRP
jgi:ABC-type uncharacterized transport system substrate-binding protein